MGSTSNWLYVRLSALNNLRNGTTANFIRRKKIDSVLVPLLGKEPATLNGDMTKAFRKALDRIKSEGATYQYPESIKQCKFGDVVLWGPDEASTIASSSASAS